MSMYYSMILVPSDARLRPAPERIVGFLDALLELGPLGRADEICLRDHARGRVKFVGRNPLTGERMEHRSPAITRIESTKALASVLRELTDFDVQIQGTGLARVLPIRDVGGLEEDGTWRPLDELVSSGTGLEDHALRVDVCQRAKLTSTSDLHEENEHAAPLFGEACEPGDRTGLYSNPMTGELIHVPDAGYSSFWISFTLGKWLFPRFAHNRIDFAEPRVVRLAEAAFGSKFAEGCSWG